MDCKSDPLQILEAKVTRLRRVCKIQTAILASSVCVLLVGASYNSNKEEEQRQDEGLLARVANLEKLFGPDGVLNVKSANVSDKLMIGAGGTRTEVEPSSLKVFKGGVPALTFDASGINQKEGNSLTLLDPGGVKRIIFRALRRADTENKASAGITILTQNGKSHYIVNPEDRIGR